MAKKQERHQISAGSITCNVSVAAGEKLMLTTTSATGEIASELFYDDGQ